MSLTLTVTLDSIQNSVVAVPTSVVKKVTTAVAADSTVLEKEAFLNHEIL